MPAQPLGFPAGGMMMTDARMATELPSGAQPWPPAEFDPVTYDYRVWDAWWSGDPDKLMRAYYSLGANSPIGRQYFATSGERGISAVRPGQYRGGLLGSIRRFFWGIPTPPGEKRTNYHVPLAGDLASASSNLLFAQPPTLRYDGDTATQDALNGLIDDGMHAKLIEAAETAAALGGVYLRVVWDSDVAGSAWLDLVPPDAAVPQFRYDRLVAVTFWTVIHDDGSTVVRHLEKHIPHENVILHGVFVGDQKKLGRRVDLRAFPQTAPIADACNTGEARAEAIHLPDLPGDASTVVYVPNMRPNRIWRDLGPWTAPLGRSDYSGLESLMDALDEAYSSWMRDIRLGKARLLVPNSYLDNIGRGKGAVFEPEREVYSPLNMLVSGETGTAGIQAHQFDIRYQAHQATCGELVERIVSMAGYSGQSLGLKGDVAQTATEVVARERKSLTTRGKKILYWRPGMADVIYGLLAVNQQIFGGQVDPVRPDIEFADVVMPDMGELSQTIGAFRAADVMSMETAVARINPGWTPGEVAAEVTRILAETNDSALARATIALGNSQNETLTQQLNDLTNTAAASDGDNPGDIEATAQQSDTSGLM